MKILPLEPAMKPRIRAFSGLVTLFAVLNISWASSICSLCKRERVNFRIEHRCRFLEKQGTAVSECIGRIVQRCVKNAHREGQSFPRVCRVCLLLSVRRYANLSDGLRRPDGLHRDARSFHGYDDGRRRHDDRGWCGGCDCWKKKNFVSSLAKFILERSWLG